MLYSAWLSPRPVKPNPSSRTVLMQSFQDFQNIQNTQSPGTQDDGSELLSKSEIKRRHQTMAQFVKGLSSLTANQLSLIQLPEEALQVILKSKDMKSSGSKNRFLKLATNTLMNDETWSLKRSSLAFTYILKNHVSLNKVPRHIFK